jgi:hypothetical protein
VINRELLTVQAVKHTQAGVVQDVHLDRVVEVLKVLLLFGKVVLSDALKHCGCGLLPEETLVKQQHPEMSAVPDWVVM